MNWGEHRVFFHDERGLLLSLPARWTDVLPPEPLVAMGRGRSPFRVDDLLQLAELIQQVERSVREGRDSGCVK